MEAEPTENPALDKVTRDTLLRITGSQANVVSMVATVVSASSFPLLLFILTPSIGLIAGLLNYQILRPKVQGLLIWQWCLLGAISAAAISLAHGCRARVARSIAAS